MAGALVLMARRDSGLSQRELAKRAGVSRSTIAEIEAGTRDPGINTLRSVLKGAGLDLSVHLVPYDDHDDVLEQTLAAMPPDERARIERGVEEFVKQLAAGLATSRPLIPHDE
jgi:transcriptional regulator with XRE-family HTH domain